MQVAQAINYLESAANMPPAEMSPAMFTLLRSCARLVTREYPVDADGTIAGYYDPEYSGARAKVADFLCRPAAAPVSKKTVADPFGSMLDLI